jgi:hypothetical protein
MIHDTAHLQDEWETVRVVFAVTGYGARLVRAMLRSS